MQPTLHEKFIAVIRRKRYALRTERTSWAWVLSFLRFCRHAAGGAWRHPRDLGAADIEAFLSHLAVERRVAAATQNQAVNSIVFLYKQVLEPDPGTFNAVRARPSQRVPTMLSRREVHAVLTNLAAVVGTCTRPRCRRRSAMRLANHLPGARANCKDISGGRWSPPQLQRMSRSHVLNAALAEARFQSRRRGNLDFVAERLHCSASTERLGHADPREFAELGQRNAGR